MHASVAHNNIDTHLERSRPKATFTKAKRPTLQYTVLNAFKKRDLVTFEHSTTNINESSYAIWYYHQKWKISFVQGASYFAPKRLYMDLLSLKHI